MPAFVILAAMKGRFISDRGNYYDNFQMMGYLEATTPMAAVTNFFDQPPTLSAGKMLNTFGPSSLRMPNTPGTTAIMTGFILTRSAVAMNPRKPSRKGSDPVVVRLRIRRQLRAIRQIPGGKLRPMSSGRWCAAQSALPALPNERKGPPFGGEPAPEYRGLPRYQSPF